MLKHSKKRRWTYAVMGAVVVGTSFLLPSCKMVNRAQSCCRLEEMLYRSREDDFAVNMLRYLEWVEKQSGMKCLMKDEF